MREKVIDFYKNKIKDKLFCINAGSLEQKNEFKKEQQRNFLKSFYLNYGLLERCCSKATLNKNI